jgi:dCMP deaminase
MSGSQIYGKLKDSLDKTHVYGKIESSRPPRPTWTEFFSEIVKVTAKRSPCERLQVGCLLVRDNRIVSQGYNGFLAGLPHESVVRNDHEQATVHAEQNAITDCAKRGVSTDGAIAFVTHYPCLNCCKLLLSAGISQINYINDYRNDELVELFCKQKKVKITKIKLS